MDGWRQALTSAIEGIPQDVTPKAIRQVFNAGIKARQPAKPVSNHQQFIADWVAAFEAKFKVNYVFMPKDAAAVKRLLADFEPAHVLRIAKAAWEHTDHYPCGLAGTLPKLLSHINEIRVWLNANRNGKKEPAKAMPDFKRLEVLKNQVANHPCNPRSIAFNPDSASLKDDYNELKREVQALELAEARRARAS